MSSRLRIVIAVTAAIMTASIAPAFAFDLGKLLNNSNQPENFKVIRVQALASMMDDSSSHVNIYDANGWGLRTRAGIIPGAHLLSSDDKYDTAKELPSDKSAKLVFYCADLH